MNEYIIIFLKGAVASLPSIVAVVGIVINNTRASSRQNKDRNIRIKMDLVNDIYKFYNDLSKKYIEMISSVERQLYDIQEEIIYSGTDNCKQRYYSELYEISKQALFLAVYKRKIIDVYELRIDADELAKHICDVVKQIQTYASVIVYISKLYIVEFYKIGNSDLVTEMVINELKADSERIEETKDCREACQILYDLVGNPSEEKVKNWNVYLDSFSEDEKRRISAGVKFIIRSYVKEIDNKAQFFTDFEEQIANEVKRLSK